MSLFQGINLGIGLLSIAKNSSNVILMINNVKVETNK
jgi:hypothetical protein